jgi:hypothetical protein
MRIRPAGLWWVLLLPLIVIGTAAYFLLFPREEQPDIVNQARQTLRSQGFKTDLADFDFSTSPEMQVRESILKSSTFGRAYLASGSGLGIVQYPQLMLTCQSNSAFVVWKMDYLEMSRSGDEKLPWNDLRDALSPNDDNLDAACYAISEGPIAFNLDARQANMMRLPHLSLLNGLIQQLSWRMMIGLHDGDRDTAWTNLLAATRLVTAWNPEPVEISHFVRFANEERVFDATWQALQTDGWPDAQLAQFQAEWESVNFFTNLPETAAYKRACESVAFQERQKRFVSPGGSPMGQIFRLALENPSMAWRQWSLRWKMENYIHGGIYQDEVDMLMFYRDREAGLRQAIQVPTWKQMQSLAVATNSDIFESGRALFPMMGIGITPPPLRGREISLLGRAAQAEARRRILITAIALKRYDEKYHSFPDTLLKLSPEFLKEVPMDFMDGKPLRYRLTDDGQFVLYSVGLDCVDDGGQLHFATQYRPAVMASYGPGLYDDIVWPAPATAAEIAATETEELSAQAQQEDSAEEMAAAAQWAHTARHQTDAMILLAAPPQKTPDANYEGKPLSDILRNDNTAGTNHWTLGQMLTLKQTITGEEPETITYKVPINYDVMTNIAELFLNVDTNNDDSDEGSVAQQATCSRADDGDCLLAWNTIFESPGLHAISLDLQIRELYSPNGQDYSGPVIPFTVTNLCQVSTACSEFDPATGAIFHAKLPEMNGNYTIDLYTTNGALLKAISGSTSNGIIKTRWDLMNDDGSRFTNDFFNSVFHITLPDSGRSQVMRGP